MASTDSSYKKEEQPVIETKSKPSPFASPLLYVLIVIGLALIAVDAVFSFLNIGKLPPNAVSDYYGYIAWGVKNTDFAGWFANVMYDGRNEASIYSILASYGDLASYISFGGILFYILAVVIAVLNHKDPIHPKKGLTVLSGFFLGLGFFLCFAPKAYCSISFLLLNDVFIRAGVSGYDSAKFLDIALPTYIGTVASLLCLCGWGALVLGVPKFVAKVKEGYGPDVEFLAKRRELEVTTYGKKFSPFYKRVGFYILGLLALIIPFGVIVISVFANSYLFDTYAYFQAFFNWLSNHSQQCTYFYGLTVTGADTIYVMMSEIAFLVLNIAFAAPFLLLIAALFDVFRVISKTNDIDHSEVKGGGLKAWKVFFLVLGCLLSIGTFTYVIVTVVLNFPFGYNAMSSSADVDALNEATTTAIYLISVSAGGIILPILYIIFENKAFAIASKNLPFPMSHVLDPIKKAEEEEEYAEVDDEPTELDPLIANKKSLGEIEDEKLPSPLVLKDKFMAYAATCGIKIDEKNSVRILAAMQSSRLIFIKGLSTDEQTKLTGALGNFFGGRYYNFEEVPQPAELLDLDKNIIEDSDRKMVFVGILNASGNIFSGDLKQVLPPLYDSYSTYQVAGFENSVHLEPNLYTLVYLGRGEEGFDLDEEALTYGVLIHVLVNDCAEKDGGEAIPMGPYDFLRIGVLAAEENYFEEASWKKIDALENFVSSKKKYWIPNDIRNAIERSSAFYLSCAYHEEDALDACLASQLLPSLIKIYPDKIEELENQVGVIFGEDKLNKLKDVFDIYQHKSRPGQGSNYSNQYRQPQFNNPNPNYGGQSPNYGSTRQSYESPSNNYGNYANGGSDQASSNQGQIDPYANPSDLGGYGNYGNDQGGDR